MLTRIGDATQQARLAATLQATQGRLYEAQAEVATGKRAQSFEPISRDAGLLLRAKDQRQLASAQSTAATLANDRVRASEAAVGNLAEIADGFRVNLVQRLDATAGKQVPIAEFASNLLDEVTQQLNLKLDERYLFGGSRGDQLPVTLPAAPFTAIDPAQYFNGDEAVAAVRTGGGEIHYGVTAAAEPFAQLLSALGTASAAHQADDRAGLATALDGLDRAIAGLAELRGSLGATSARLERAAEDRGAAVDYLGEIVGRIENADVPAAMARLAQDQTSLEAAYIATSRLSNLSLADYLR